MLIHDLLIKCRFKSGYRESIIGPVYRELLSNTKKLTGKKRLMDADDIALIEHNLFQITKNAFEQYWVDCINDAIDHNILDGDSVDVTSDMAIHSGSTYITVHTIYRSQCAGVNTDLQNDLRALSARSFRDYVYGCWARELARVYGCHKEALLGIVAK